MCVDCCTVQLWLYDGYGKALDYHQASVFPHKYDNYIHYSIVPLDTVIACHNQHCNYHN